MQMFRLLFRLSLIAIVAVPFPSQQREVEKHAASVQVGASPEMTRLAKALAGDWNTTETMEPSQFFPDGGSRHGTTHVQLVAAGTTLLDRVHSDGTAGKLDGFLAIWWDGNADVYHFFACFNSASNPCKDRGTAHWEGETFINDYEEDVDGKKTKFRDSFIQITETSHTLVAAMDTGNGTMKTLITTKSTRQR